MEEKIKEIMPKEKPSYEDMEKEVIGLKSMNNQLLMQLQQMNINHIFKRLDYLFKVVKYKEAFGEEFSHKCIEEIIEHMTPPEEEVSNAEE